MSDVVEINCPEQLDECRLPWQALWGETRHASIFQTLDWLQAYWRFFGGGQRLKVLLVTSNGTPIGILPLAVMHEPTRLGRIRTLTYPLADWGSFYGPIGPNPTATLTTAMQYLAATRRTWDLLDLRPVDRENVDRGRTQRAMQWAGFQARERVWKECAAIEVTGTWDDYLAGRTSRFRNDLRRCLRQTHALGDVRYVRHRPESLMSGDGDPRWDLYDQCLHVAARSWQGSSTTGNTLCHSRVREFFRDAHALAAKLGMLDVHLLLLGDRPIAFAYNYHCDGYLQGVRTGYDPAFAHVGLGKAMLSYAFRTSFQQGDHTIDLGPDYLAAKRPWLTRLCQSHRYTHYPLAAPRTQLLRLKHWLFGPSVTRPVPRRKAGAG